MDGHMLGIESDRLKTAEAIEIDPLALLDHLNLGVLVCEIDADHGCLILTANKSAQDLILIDPRLVNRGDAGSAVLAEKMTLDDIPVLEFGEPLLSEFHRALRLQRPVHYEWKIESVESTKVYSCTITPLDQGGAVKPRILCTLTDKTTEKRAQANLLHHALHDHLTGLPNRSHFLNRLEDEVARCKNEEGRACAVLMLNVDRFQLINEGFGHPIGDEFLIEMANSLRACLRNSDLLARFNGDEFAILIDDIEGLEDATGLAKRIHEMMKAPRKIAGVDAYMSVGIGVTTSEISHKHAEDMIRDADISMHRAKKRGPSRTFVFAAESNTVRTGQIQLETDLRHAIENGDLELYYQPIIDLENGNSIAFEALTRWHHPIHGPVSPARFIPIAEDSGLILPLGRWAMMEACQQLATWQKSIKNTQNIYVNVNMSAVQLLEDEISRTVAHCLAQSGLEGRNLRLEITESALVANPEFAARCLHEIKELGPTLALDDFGTGYSSLNYLNSFPIDCIKIDRSFVGQVDRDEQSSKIIRIITMLADTLRMSVVAEGIETSEQHMMMRSLGCRYGQGYLFSRPLPKKDATAHLRKQFKP
ncbi:MULTISPECIES: bifunctional diguanylate cyclase/phosphodiesterase [unclassified Iodidimonas]|uniref:putative bifunctional diguanylate cyclase/phosphodiesterase n=1 Tax=unclassified Iodidimonas TaxID=2626145 RepID=UPI002482CB9E|nr:MULTISPECIES: bifunctional diguanylate cyclase/phosphodiesterase [unclassified Iodidimonas]